MKAIIQTAYGNPNDVLEYADIEKPVPGEDEVLIRVLASSITFGDLAAVQGEPYIARLSLGLNKPKIKTPGKDVAGLVESVGTNVSEFKPGDRVFGDLSECGWGTFSEFVTAPTEALAHMPGNLSWEEAGGVPESGVVALQGLRKGRIQSGQKVLIYGASGGIGTFAVQIAKALDTQVTGVCSTRNVEMVRSLGADHVIDYTREDFTRTGKFYDLIVAAVGYRSLFDYRRALAPGGHYVAIGGKMAQIFQPMLLGPLLSGSGRVMTNLAMKPDKEDLTFIRDLIESGKVSTIIDKQFSLSELPQALAYYGEGRSRGKVIISIQHKGNLL